MFNSLTRDIKQQFAFGNRITRLIMLNVAIWVLVNIVRLGFVIAAGMQQAPGFDEFMRYISLNSELTFDALHPWVLFTHMFVHIGLFHILFNMLFLYWFGRIMGDFLGDHRVYPVYLMSGLAGAFLYLVTAKLFPGGSTLIGASGAVMGIVVAAGTIAPDYVMRLLFIGDVKLKYIVLVLVAIDIFALGSLSNFGGHAAHIGGALFGYVFVTLLKQGTDLSVPVNNLFAWFQRLLSGEAKPKKKKSRAPMYVQHAAKGKQQRRSGKPRSKDHQARLDQILDKIKASGYESLSEEEKEFLFQASKK